MKKLIALVLSLLMVLCSVAVLAETEETVTESKGTLIMATNAFFPPYEFYEGTEIVGIDVEIAAAVAAKMGYDFEVIDIDFDAIIRELNQMGYHGPLCVEWEDSGMERMFGAKEACEFTHKINFEPSTVAFDAALKND